MNSSVFSNIYWYSLSIRNLKSKNYFSNLFNSGGSYLYESYLNTSFFSAITIALKSLSTLALIESDPIAILQKF